jgi:hypothetical protein
MGKRLAAILDDGQLRRLYRRSPRSCTELAVLARKIEEASSAAGEAAGRAAAAVTILPWRMHAEHIVQALVTRTVLAAGGPITEALVRHLRVIGIWSCALTARLDSCACLRDLAAGRTLEWVRDTVGADLTELWPVAE